jgi:hypothetical protein
MLIRSHSKILINLVFCLCFYFSNKAQVEVERIPNSPYPATTQPDTIYLFHDDLFTHDELLLLQSIQGLCAKIEPKLYRDKGSGSSIWIQDLEDNYAVYVSNQYDGIIDSVLTLVPNSVTGYILCNLNDNSTNVANSLCGPLNAISVTPELQELVDSKGYIQILDVRQKDEQWVLDNYDSLLNTNLVTYQREDKALFLGDYSIFTNAFHFYDDIHGLTTENAFSRMETNSLLFGWGDDEYQTVSKSSSYSIGVLPADWGFNISTLTNFNANTVQQVSSELHQIEPGTHTVCFLMSDGDNIQWMLNLFAEDSRWFGSQNRGLMDIGWTIPPSLSEIAPTVMAKIYSMAQSTELGKDYFVAGPSGHSYHFPELFPELEASCSLMNDYLEKSGLSIVNILGNNPSETVFQPELKQYLKQDQVSGLFYYDYSNYSKMQGQLDCYALKPVVAARYNLWGGFETCESLAQKINAAPKDPLNPNSYTLVAVHAWSNSVDSLLLVKSLLDQGVRVVAPDAFVQLISDAICAPQQQETLILEAFPNPFSETIRLKIKGYESSDFELKIQDVSGKEIRATQVRLETFDGWVCDFTFKNKPAGIYFIHFSTPEHNETLKVLKSD